MTPQQHVLDFYAQPSPLTSAGRYTPLFAELPTDVVFNALLNRAESL